MNLEDLETNQDGTPKPGQVFFDNGCYWLTTTKGKLESLGANARCATLNGAHAVWQKLLDLKHRQDETDQNYNKRRNRAPAKAPSVRKKAAPK